MRLKKIDLTRRISMRAQAMRSDRLRRAAAATGTRRTDVDDAARRATWGI